MPSTVSKHTKYSTIRDEYVRPVSSENSSSSIASKMVPVWDKLKLSKSQGQKGNKSKKAQYSLSQSSPREILADNNASISISVPTVPTSAPRSFRSVSHNNHHDHSRSPNVANRKVIKGNKPNHCGIIEKGTVVRNSWLVLFIY